MLKTGGAIAILGASSGIGEALSLGLAGPGVRLALAARRHDRLADVATHCRKLGATVDIATLDVRDAGSVGAWIADIDDRAPVGLFVCCAGIFDGSRTQGAVETSAAVHNLIDTNLKGPIAAANSMAARMQARGQGRIALVSSLAALIPQADAPTYSATKAGLTAYAAALRELVHPMGVQVTIIHPGHVATAQTDQQLGRLPMLMTPQAAAARIIKGLEAGRSQINFPWALAIYARIYPWMPYFAQRLANAGVRFVVRDPVD